jgi:hypothetical protein
MMVGKVSVNNFFIESNGGGDPDTYTWTCDDMKTIVTEIAASLSFWSKLAAGHGAPLTFFTQNYRPAVPGPGGCAGTPNAQNSWEPILHPHTDDYLWIEEAMCKQGYCIGDKYERTDNFNAARRIAVKTSWATTSFIGYNPSPAPTAFTDGWHSYAVLNGPYSQLLMRNSGWGVSGYDKVNSHETGHLFGALDEYAASGCADCDTCIAEANLVVNGNCENCASASVPCIMRVLDPVLCPYTPGQIGWGLKFNTVNTTKGTTTATVPSWKPGQEIDYHINYNAFGDPDHCVEVHTRWFRHFQSNISEGPDVYEDFACLGSAHDWWLNGTVPAGAERGEASAEVQVELKFANGCYYGKGVRSSARGSFFVIDSSANPSIAPAPSTAPAAPRTSPAERMTAAGCTEP